MIHLEAKINFLVSQILMEIRGNFKWEEFKKIDDPFMLADYPYKSGAMYLGEGTSRIVFLLNNRFVLKVVQPYDEDLKKGQAQNKAEVEISKDPTAKDYVAHVYDYNKDYNWIVSELVRPLTGKKEFEKLTGVNFHVFRLALITLFTTVNGNLEDAIRFLEKKSVKAKHEPERKIAKEAVEFLKHNKWGKGLIEFLKKNNIITGDIVTWTHWGKTADGRPVILDYGYTKSVREKHYSRRRW